MASPRNEWEPRISELLVQAAEHKTTYFEQFGYFGVYIHPSVYSPKYFPETLWYGEKLPAIVQGRSFLEVGVGSGLVSLHLAATGSTVTGVDINVNAVEIARKNFLYNNQRGTFLVSDIFDNVSGKFDYIFWNHPWQIDAGIPSELKSEKTFDQGYRLLERFVAQAKNHLSGNGSLLLGTSAYADLEATEAIFVANGYTQKVICRGQRSIGKGVTEEYYIIQAL